MDKGGTPIVVTTYNLSPGKGVIIGDTVAIAEPYFTPIDIEPQSSQYKFSMVRVQAECVRQRNEVAIKLGIIFLSFFLSLFPPSAQNHRRGCRRI